LLRAPHFSTFKFKGNDMNTPQKSVNAWILLPADQSDPSYQNLIQHKVFSATDMISLCWVGTAPTSSSTVPSGDGSSYTIDTTFTGDVQAIVADARAINPNIKILVMLGYGGNELSNIFLGYAKNEWDTQAKLFASNVLTYLQLYGLNGFDIDWELPLSGETDSTQVQLVLSALRAAFDGQLATYYLTMSPATPTNLDGKNINATLDFMTLQLYSGFTSANQFTGIGVDANLLAYGAKFESTGNGDIAPYQDASNAYQQMQQGNYSITTQWRLNSGNYQYEQAQQMMLYQLIYNASESQFDDSAIISTAGNPPISQIVIRSGEVLDSLQVTNCGQFCDPATNCTLLPYALMQHGGNGGSATTVTIAAGDSITEVSGYTGVWYGWDVVLQITLKTAKGLVYGPFGSMDGASSRSAFTYTAPAGKSIVAFSGSTVQVPEAGGGDSFVMQSLNVTCG
jgi:hypothetical protein